jgi:hypothetical protein
MSVNLSALRIIIPLRIRRVPRRRERLTFEPLSRPWYSQIEIVMFASAASLRSLLGVSFFGPPAAFAAN